MYLKGTVRGEATFKKKCIIKGVTVRVSRPELSTIVLLIPDV